MTEKEIIAEFNKAKRTYNSVSRKTSNFYWKEVKKLLNKDKIEQARIMSARCPCPVIGIQIAKAVEHHIKEVYENH